MGGERRAILIDGRVNGLPGAHGLARSLTGLAAHLDQGDAGLPVRVLVNTGREQLFPLAAIAGRAELVPTGITLGAVHRFAGLARLVSDCDAGVLYVPYPLFRPLRCPCPYVVTVHDCTIENDTTFAGGRHRQAGFQVAARAVLARAAAVTTPTKSSLEDLQRRYPGAPNPVIVPNGVDAARFAAAGPAAAAAARASYGLPERYILSVGAHRPHKNHGVLVRAMLAVPPPACLVIVGYPDPNFRACLPRLIDELGLSGRVRLVPSVREEHLAGVYRGAAAFAFPSLAEGYGMPVLEAMAAGVPVVASAIAVLEEVAAGAALLVPPADPAAWAGALNRVLAGGPAVRDMIQAGSGAAAAATWQRGGQALGGLLAAVAAGRPPVSG